MEVTGRLAALRAQIVLFEGETAFEGWAAERLSQGERQPGLALLTNWRLIVADIGGGFSAVPIAKIDQIDLPTATTVRLSVWYESISLDLESAAAAATLVNCLLQDTERRASVAPRPHVRTRPLCEIAAADKEPARPVWPISTIAPAPISAC